MGKNPDPGTGIRNKHPISNFPKSIVTIIWVKMLKFFVADPGSGAFVTLDPGSGIENPDPGSGMIRNTD